MVVMPVMMMVSSTSVGYSTGMQNGSANNRGVCLLTAAGKAQREREREAVKVERR